MAIANVSLTSLYQQWIYPFWLELLKLIIKKKKKDSWKLTGSYGQHFYPIILQNTLLIGS